jgi:pilus assembly protein CpaF
VDWFHIGRVTMTSFGKRTIPAESPASAITPARVVVSGSAQMAASALKTADLIRDQVLLRIEPVAAVRMNKPELTAFVNSLVAEIANERKLLLNQTEQDVLTRDIVDEMIGLGPIEPLLHDPTVSDILVNGPHMIYVERRGKLELTGLRFRHDAHVLHVAQRIASYVGRSVDESNPMLDARLADGSRVNVIIPPLSLKGPSISIRKFSQKILNLKHLAAAGSMSPALATALEIFARCRLNIIVSGGTGSGKTTLLNALSGMIDPGERIITIEDAAELQLQQKHVIQLETRPANLEGRGRIDQGGLVRNALRMRPDRIIVGEVRGGEAFDMMQAMNTGHDGSMSTVHSNSARDALARLENMVLMGNPNIPVRSIRGQIASAVDIVIHTERMRDGARRVTEVAEVVGMEGEIIVLGPLFHFEYKGEKPGGSIDGEFKATPVCPRFISRIRYFGLEDQLLDAIGVQKRWNG